jgi:hypothetical protein
MPAARLLSGEHSLRCGWGAPPRHGAIEHRGLGDRRLRVQLAQVAVRRGRRWIAFCEEGYSRQDLAERQHRSRGSQRRAEVRRSEPAAVAGRGRLRGHLLGFHMAIGRARLEQRTRALGSYLRCNAAEISKVMSCGSIGKLKEYLRRKFDAYVPSGRESLRISTNFFNTYEQCDRVLKALKELSTGAA